jgi:hypothetical protein
MTIGAEFVLRCKRPWAPLGEANCSGYDPGEGRTVCRHLRHLHGDGGEELCTCESPTIRKCVLAILLTEMEVARNDVRREESYRELGAMERGECPVCGRPLAIDSEKPWASFNGKLRGVEQRVSCRARDGGCGEIQNFERIVVQEDAARREVVSAKEGS